MRWELLSSCYLTRKCAKTVLGGALNIGPLVTPKSSAPLPKNVGRLISEYAVSPLINLEMQHDGRSARIG